MICLETLIGDTAVLHWLILISTGTWMGTIPYLFVFNCPEDGKLNIPNFKNKVVSANLLAINSKLETTESDEGLFIHLPLKDPDKMASVVKLKIKGKFTK